MSFLFGWSRASFCSFSMASFCSFASFLTIIKISLTTAIRAVVSLTFDEARSLGVVSGNG